MSRLSSLCRCGSTLVMACPRCADALRFHVTPCRCESCLRCALPPPSPSPPCPCFACPVRALPLRIGTQPRNAIAVLYKAPAAQTMPFHASADQSLALPELRILCFAIARHRIVMRRLRFAMQLRASPCRCRAGLYPAHPVPCRTVWCSADAVLCPASPSPCQPTLSISIATRGPASTCHR